MPGPIPFPLSTRVGTDLCSVPRITALLQRCVKGVENPLNQQGSVQTDSDEHLKVGQGLQYRDRLEQWGLKVFNRLEWPAFKERSRNYADQSASRRTMFERWTAGRFAAKEAAVKAHIKRKLFLPTISVLVPPPPQQRIFKYRQDENDRRPVMLIDPPSSKVIKMSPAVARKRGLRARVIPKRDKGNALISLLNEQQEEEEISDGPSFYDGEFYRAPRIRMEHRRVADVSISHDGKYAFATALAVEDYEIPSQNPEFVDDNGEGEPIHEPEWGDEGWDDIEGDLDELWRSMFLG